MMREEGSTQGKGGGVDNFVRSFAQGVSLGLADEFAAAADATVGPLVDMFTDSGTSKAPAWGERYSQNLVRERG